MYLVEYYDKLKAIHDAQPIAADSPKAALQGFRDRFIVGHGWGDTVIPIAAHKKAPAWPYSCPECGRGVDFDRMKNSAEIRCYDCGH